MNIDADQLHATNRHILASVRLLLANQPPEYGSPAWLALSVDHPDRDRAVLQAAEAWRHYWQADAIAERLRAELDLIDRVTLERFKAASADVSVAWDAARYCTGPTQAELQRRRTLTSRVPCAVCSRPVDLVHPLPNELAARLPDTSWVRCASRHPLAITKEIAA
ncbi:MAG TPA: hypothetical protein VH333_00800 [Pseudonocardiaceae bacterium]|jgi:hypothetical protein|nr:hypothetical protein [Pseudonocardiaceae bacterium]